MAILEDIEWEYFDVNIPIERTGYYIRYDTQTREEAKQNGLFDFIGYLRSAAICAGGGYFYEIAEIGYPVLFEVPDLGIF